MKVHNWSFLVLGCLGLLLQGIGSALTAAAGRNDTLLWLGILVAVLGAVAIAAGSSFLAIGKGQSPWFGLWGLLSPVGLLFLCVLEDRSPKQGVETTPP
jgi:drug/metabolite transporter (DMT)-like permease